LIKSIVFDPSILKYSSESINTGLALLYDIALTEEINVKLGTMTSSPDLTPATFKAICSAAVPLTQATL
jgi:hypothetical protein